MLLRTWLVGSGAVLVALSLSTVAHAENPPARATTSTTSTTSTDRAWYGWQIAISDAAAGGLMYWGLEVNRALLLYSGLAVYIIVPPGIHGAHESSGNDGAALLSFGLRVLGPTLMVLSAAKGSSDDASGHELEAEDQPRPATGLLLVVSALDVVVLSWPAVWSGPQKDSTSFKSSKSAFQPRISLQHDGAVLGAIGTF